MDPVSRVRSGSRRRWTNCPGEDVSGSASELRGDPRRIGGPRGRWSPENTRLGTSHNSAARQTLRARLREEQRKWDLCPGVTSEVTPDGSEKSSAGRFS